MIWLRWGPTRVITLPPTTAAVAQATARKVQRTKIAWSTERQTVTTSSRRRSTGQMPHDQEMSNKTMPRSQGGCELLGVFISFRCYRQPVETERPEDFLRLLR
ncbi:hypothetical protein F5882DRAFT_21253 [Hyaloscypha sp. PMI_1271]|nr:hypothetical protein F5882DRAFT_21253 [Hyaloscypha sp. PMI_1271]